MTVHSLTPASVVAAQANGAIPAPPTPPAPPAAGTEGLDQLGQLSQLSQLGQLGQLGQLAELAKQGRFAQLSPTQEQQLEKAIEDAVREAMQAATAQRSGDQEGAALARERAQAAVDAIRAKMEEARAQTRTTVQVAPFPPDVIPPQAVDMAMAFFATIAFIAVGIPIARAFARRMDRRSAPAPADLGPRLDRIEQAVEAVAIEVERISENQRYATRIMTELRGLPAPSPDGWPGGVAREAAPVRGSGESR